MEPLSEIIETYNPVLTEDCIENFIDYSNSQNLKDLIQEFDIEIEKEKKVLGIENKKGIEFTKSEVKNFKKAIKNNPNWLNSLDKLMTQCVPSKHHQKSENYLDALILPWWNQKISMFKNDEYKDEKFKLYLGETHSYICQAAREQKIPKKVIDCPSISGITISNDDYIFVGLRGFNYRNNEIMSLPAGSIETLGLYESYYKELNEELNLKKENLTQSNIIGKIFDNNVAFNSLFVVESHTKFNANELENHWQNALDKKEQKKLLQIKNTSQGLSNFLKHHSTNEPFLLPAATMSLMVYGKKTFGDNWYKSVKQDLADSGLVYN